MAEAILFQFPAPALIPAEDGELVAGDSYAPLEQTTSGRLVRSFDATDEEAVVTDGVKFPGVSGTLKARLHFFSDTANSGSLQWDVYVEAHTPDSDTFDMEATASSWATANTPSSHTMGGTAGDPRTQLITLTNDDGAVAGDYIRFGIRRDSDGDTMTGDIFLWLVEIIDET